MVEALMCRQAWSREDLLGEGDSKSLWTCLEHDEEMMDDDVSVVADVYGWIISVFYCSLGLLPI